MLPIESAFQVFTDRNGKPLENGYVYFGLPNLNPITSPIPVYWDAAGTQPAVQPLRTVNGYIMRAGTPANVFVASAYSELVQDSKKRTVFYARNSDDFSVATLVSAFLAGTSAPSGAAQVGFIQAGAGAVATTLQENGRRAVYIQQFMTPAQIADSATRAPTMDATPWIQAATDALFLLGGGEVIINCVLLLKGSGGVIGGRVVDGIKIKSNVSYRGVGAGEVRLDPSCVIAFTTRLLAPVTSLAAAPHDINFFDLLITRPNSVWNESLQNTALIYIGAINRMKIQRCRFIGWNADAVGLGINDTLDLSALYETYVQGVEISGNFFDGVTKANRQAISVFEGVDVSIHHNTFTRTTRSGGADPMPGAVDIEPILASAKVANIRVEDNVFDDIGGVTGVVSFALGVALTSPAHDLTVKNNTFRNISNVADVYAIGLAAPDHTAAAVGSPYTTTISGNTHDPLSGATTNRRYYLGGLIGLTVEDNTIYGSNAQMLIGYDDGTKHWPIDNLVFNDNECRDLCPAGTQFDPAIVFFGGIRNGKISGNQFINCGNVIGAPTYLTTLGFVGNGVASSNIEISRNQFINTSGFSVNSTPIYASALTNAATFSVKNNTFHGLGSEAYNSIYSMYAQVPCDFYDGVIPIPSTNTPNVAGARNFNGTTGDTFINFSNGKAGQRITLIATGSGFTVANNANVKTSTAANVVVAAGKTIELVNMTGIWYQV